MVYKPGLDLGLVGLDIEMEEEEVSGGITSSIASGLGLFKNFMDPSLPLFSTSAVTNTESCTWMGEAAELKKNKMKK